MSHWASTATTDNLIQRAKLLGALRHFLDERGLTEVQTPVLNPRSVSDVNIDSVAVADPEGFLRTSPEYAHKRLLAGGMGDLYEIGPVFRAKEDGRLHRVEFTLLEWYRIGLSWQKLAKETLELCQFALKALGQAHRTEHWYDWSESFTTQGLPDPLTASDDAIAAASTELPADCDRDMRLDWLFSTRIQPELPTDGLTIVHSFPASQAALARLNPEDPRKAQRFELFAGDIELANGYQELTDWREQADRFEQDNQRRQELGRRTMAIDEDFLSALKAGLPECAGVALGVDRLAMVVLGQSDIAQTRSF
ncbi:MAG: EF-P lysine aminoacylase EpmA [Pseudomonadota bacterium]